MTLVICHMKSKKKFRLIPGSWFLGVCEGIGEFFEIDPLWVRILFLVGLFSPLGSQFLVLYLIIGFLAPAKD